MHTPHRDSVLSTALIILCISAVGSLALAQDTPAAIEGILDQAKEAYRDVREARAARIAASSSLRQLERDLHAAAQERRALRLKVAHLRSGLAKVQRQIEDSDTQQQKTERDMTHELAQFRAFVRLSHVRRIEAETGPTGRTMRLVFAHVLGDSLGDSVQYDLSADALQTTREDLITSLRDARLSLDDRMMQLQVRQSAFEQKLDEAEAAFEKNAQEYRGAMLALAAAKDEIVVSDEQKAEEQAIMAEVAAQVAAAQSQLARINEREQRKAERDLIRLGILDARPGSHANYEAPKMEGFIWPVTGRISAGFHDAAYARFFGFGHSAIDIVTPAGTPVKAAADGVVLVVHNGGAKGTSYTLIGHAGGFTTLYMHLSAQYLQEGSEVSQGQIVGLSGGLPGAQGTGPYSTGAHLHFQVTENGVKVNPLPLLPS